MADKQYTFDERSTRRIARTVIGYERLTSDQTDQRRQRGGGYAETCWGKLTALVDDGWEWEEVRRQTDSDGAITWVTISDGRKGDDDADDDTLKNLAVEIGRTESGGGSNYSAGSIVLLRRIVTELPGDEGEEPTWLPGWAIVTIPQPTERYQVYTPVDDSLLPVWTTARFVEGE